MTVHEVSYPARLAVAGDSVAEPMDQSSEGTDADRIGIGACLDRLARATVDHLAVQQDDGPTIVVGRTWSIVAV